MKVNQDSQTATYGGQIKFAATFSYANIITIPLFIKTVDVPIRKPKITEINTVPVIDENVVSDWTTHTMFTGASGLLTTTIGGFLITPTSTTTDNHGQVYGQLDPTQDGQFIGYSYGDLIWAYLQGKMNQPSPSVFIRTDPSSYIDPFGNVYNNPIIQSFDCDYTVTTAKQNFQMSLLLEH